MDVVYFHRIQNKTSADCIHNVFLVGTISANRFLRCIHRYLVTQYLNILRYPYVPHFRRSNNVNVTCSPYHFSYFSVLSFN